MFLLFALIVCVFSVIKLVLLRPFGGASEFAGAADRPFQTIVDSLYTTIIFVTTADNMGDLIYSVNGGLSFPLFMMLFGNYFVLALVILIVSDDFSSHSQMQQMEEQLVLLAGSISAFCLLDVDDTGGLSPTEIRRQLKERARRGSLACWRRLHAIKCCCRASRWIWSGPSIERAWLCAH